VVMSITFVVLLIGLCEKVHADITLAIGGQPDYTIVIDQRCSPPEQHGAGELQRFLEQFCGAILFISRVPLNARLIRAAILLAD